MAISRSVGLIIPPVSILGQGSVFSAQALEKYRAGFCGQATLPEGAGDIFHNRRPFGSYFFTFSGLSLARGAKLKILYVLGRANPVSKHTGRRKIRPAYPVNAEEHKGGEGGNDQMPQGVL